MKLSYDLHSHILPGVDDGAKNSDEALRLIEALSARGIKNICLTPHFYSHQESASDFLARREAAAKEFLPLVPEDINIKLGAEVFVTKYLFSDENDLNALCLQGMPYMLTEFSYSSRFQEGSMRHIYRLRDMGIIPIIPHVERYPALMKDTAKLEDLIYMGVIIQSNAVSFTDSRSKRKLIKLLRGGYVQVLSSDTHSAEHNSPFVIPMALEYINKKCSADTIATLNRNAAEVFG